MKSAELDGGLASREEISDRPATPKNSLAKKLILKIMSATSVGRLIVEDGAESWAFGKENSELNAKIIVHDSRAYGEVIKRGTIGSAEAYMKGYWSTPCLVSLVRLMVLNQSKMHNMNSTWSWMSRRWERFKEYSRLNSIKGAKRNIAAHYDLSNDFFGLFIDDSMMYSSAIYHDPSDSLEVAAINKLDHVCKRLQLSDQDHLLEIGTGWGGMAVYAAKHYGCKVTTTTISQEQFNHAVEWVAKEGLESQVTVLLKDYRDLEGRFDKLVSIEMVEAVGYQYYDAFFAKCNRLLKEDGMMLMQCITTTDQRFHSQKNHTDFIRKYIFPGGCLPSNEIVAKHIAQDTDMQIIGLEDITQDYAYTLRDWRRRFWDRVSEVKSLGFDDRFVRMWDFYLAYCEGGFQERVINTAQFVFAKPMCRSLPRPSN